MKRRSNNNSKALNPPLDSIGIYTFVCFWLRSVIGMQLVHSTKENDWSSSFTYRRFKTKHFMRKRKENALYDVEKSLKGVHKGPQTSGVIRRCNNNNLTTRLLVIWCNIRSAQCEERLLKVDSPSRLLLAVKSITTQRSVTVIVQYYCVILYIQFISHQKCPWQLIHCLSLNNKLVNILVSVTVCNCSCQWP